NAPAVLELSGLRVSGLPATPEAGRFDLTFSVTETFADDGRPGGLRGWVTAAGDLFDPGPAARIGEAAGGGGGRGGGGSEGGGAGGGGRFGMGGMAGGWWCRGGRWRGCLRRRWRGRRGGWRCGTGGCGWVMRS